MNKIFTYFARLSEGQAFGLSLLCSLLLGGLSARATAQLVSGWVSFFGLAVVITTFLGIHMLLICVWAAKGTLRNMGAGIDSLTNEVLQQLGSTGPWQSHFHRAWAAAKEQPDYNKEAWIYVQRHMDRTEPMPIAVFPQPKQPKESGA